MCRICLQSTLSLGLRFGVFPCCDGIADVLAPWAFPPLITTHVNQLFMIMIKPICILLLYMLVLTRLHLLTSEFWFPLSSVNVAILSSSLLFFSFSISNSWWLVHASISSCLLQLIHAASACLFWHFPHFAQSLLWHVDTEDLVWVISCTHPVKLQRLIHTPHHWHYSRRLYRVFRVLFQSILITP